MISTIKKLKSGYINGTRVVLGTLEDFLSTSAITSLSFLGNTEDGDPDGLNESVKEFLERELNKPFIRKISRQSSAKRKISIRSRKSGVSGIIKRTRSIQVDQYDPGIYAFRWSISEHSMNFYYFLVDFMFIYSDFIIFGFSFSKIQTLLLRARHLLRYNAIKSQLFRI